MRKPPKFLICDNSMAETDQQYILHTQIPKALFKVILNEDNTIEFKVEQEYEQLSILTPKHLNGLYSRISKWFIAYNLQLIIKNKFNQPVFNLKPKNSLK
jgi:protease II